MPRPGVVRAVLALLALMAGLLVLVGGPALNLAAAGAHVVRVQGYSYDTASQNASEGARSHAAVQRPVSLSAGRRGVAAAGPSVSTGAGVAAEGGGGLGSRLRSINWADDTGSITLPGRSEPKLIYEANPKHGTVSRPGPRGEVSRAPRGDCQAMLECSTQIGPRLREGVEPDSGLPVVFRQHREFEGTEWWHGYVPGG